MRTLRRLVAIIPLLVLMLAGCRPAVVPAPTATLMPAALAQRHSSAHGDAFGHGDADCCPHAGAGPGRPGRQAGDGHWRQPWWNDTTFYEIFVRSFYDSNGDGIGDLNGLIQKLDYLNDGDPATTNDLGVTGIWLMPIMASPSYHGYDVTDYYQVNPEYGTNDDFKRLIQEAHRRGIRVIVDLVLNHTSSQHPWFIDSLRPDSPKRDWYVWSDEEARGQGLAPDRQRLVLRLLLRPHARPELQESRGHRRRCTTSSASGWRRWARTASGSTRSSI